VHKDEKASGFSLKRKYILKFLWSSIECCIKDEFMNFYSRNYRWLISYQFMKSYVYNSNMYSIAIGFKCGPRIFEYIWKIDLSTTNISFLYIQFFITMSNSLCTILHLNVKFSFDCNLYVSKIQVDSNSFR